MAGKSETTPAISVTKSAGDKRSYRYTTLDNGLQCLLVSDPATDKAAAAMDVNVGHFSDPDDVPGLAHFLEHSTFPDTMLPRHAVLHSSLPATYLHSTSRSQSLDSLLRGKSACGYSLWDFF